MVTYILKYITTIHNKRTLKYLYFQKKYKLIKKITKPKQHPFSRCINIIKSKRTPTTCTLKEHHHKFKVKTTKPTFPNNIATI
jgi:hypothetical protein